MPRKSMDELSIAAISIPVRPDPPKDLGAYQKTVWRDVVATKPAEWFRADSFPILRAYVVAVERHRAITKELNKMDLTDPEAKPLMDMEDKQARLMCTLATKMRLTQQSRYCAKTASAADRKTTTQKPRWET